MSAVEVETGFEHSNEVHIVGRVAAEPVLRVLPSGDSLVSWRVIVERPARERRGRANVDVVACAAWLAKVRRSVMAWDPGDIVEIDGALRRHFWRSATGAANRYEVEAHAVRRLVRAG